jgi:hypothetical protein
MDGSVAIRTPRSQSNGVETPAMASGGPFDAVQMGRLIFQPL